MLPCENGATCVEQIEGYMCQCTDQWLGDNSTGIYNIDLDGYICEDTDQWLDKNCTGIYNTNGGDSIAISRDVQCFECKILAKNVLIIIQ